MVSERDIRRAFRRYERGERPETYGTPKAWYVVDDETGRLFPLKAIWALAHEVRTRSFNTSTPIRELPVIGPGFKVVRQVKETAPAALQDRVQQSLNDKASARRARLAKAPKRPASYFQPVRVFIRNPDVIAEALFLADGTCQKCHAAAPFARRSDQTPYLEVHHKKPLADGGADTLENVIALCPNCHREAHHG